MEKTCFILLACFCLGGSVPTHPDKRLLLRINNGIRIGTINDRHIDEASGLCASRVHPNVSYTHNDHGGDNKLYAIDSKTAHVISVITVNGATNKDWEDIACGKCYGHLNDSCVYIGDIGDSGNALTVYRVEEPAVLPSKVIVSAESALKFSWNEPDAETLMVTPDAELYVISKVDHADAKIGLIPSSGWGTGSRVPITRTGSLNGVRTSHKDPRGGDISPDGNEILIKTDENILHYNMNGGKDYISVLQGSPAVLPYISEKQGESVAFSADGQSYFTLGEGTHEPLYRYDAIFSAAGHERRVLTNLSNSIRFIIPNLERNTTS